MTINDLIGKKVLTGSPGYKDEETIISVELTEAFKGTERYRIEFDSGFFTNISPGDLEFFLQRGSADFQRWYGSRADRALETIELIA